MGSEPILTLSQTGGTRNFPRRLGEAAAPGLGGVQGVPRICILYSGNCITIGENRGKSPQPG